MNNESVELFNLKLACGSLLFICVCFAIWLVYSQVKLEELKKLKVKVEELKKSLKKEQQESASWKNAAEKSSEPEPKSVDDVVKLIKKDALSFADFNFDK